MKKFLLCALLLPMFAQAQLKDLIREVAGQTKGSTLHTGNLDIASGLKEALNAGISKQVSKLTATDGFYKNAAVKILMPDELKKVDKTLRSMGMGKLADDGVKALNRAAEDAVKEAMPIFVNAIKGMSITDAKNILMGSNNAATSYLQQSTSKELYAKFTPVVQESIGKVGADKIWGSLTAQYNKLPLVSKVNPDINDYVTQKAMEGVFKMIAVEEANIRTKTSSRSSDLLKKVFALQDKK